jgi:hypothetical protein
LLTVGVKEKKLFCGFGKRKRDSFKVSARTELADID